MPYVSDIEGLPVIGVKDKVLGRVNHVLFHPTQPRAVGIELQPPAIGMVVERKPRYLALDAVDWTEAGLALKTPKMESNASSAKRLDIDWETSVVWRFMGVVTESGEVLGLARDVRFDTTDGSLTMLKLTSGVTSDVGVGAATLDGALVLGFDGEDVRVSDEASQVDAGGGVARQAGRGAAIAKVAAEETIKQAAGGAVNIAKAVKKADVTGKASRGWKSLKDSFLEGLNGEDDK